MASRKVKNLKEEFPDLSQSVLNDIAQQQPTGLATMKADFAREQQNLLDDLYLNFNHLPKEVVKQHFQQNGGDFEKTMDALIKHTEREETQARAQNLMGVFQTLPQHVIQQALDENEGDIEQTTMHLLELVNAQEAERERARLAEELRAQKEREDIALRLKVQQVLRDKFGNDLEDREISRVLQDCKWNVKDASVALHAMAVERKKTALKAQFPHVSEQDISMALDTCNYDRAATAAHIRQKFPLEAPKKQLPKPPVAQEKPALLVLEKIEQNLLDRSLVMGQELETQIKREREQNQKEAQDLFRNKMAHIIETQARYGVSPGIQPPPVKADIEERLKKPAPVQESEQVHDLQLQNQKQTAESVPLAESSIRYPVRLSVTPSIIDVGNPVTVHYEILSGESNSWDWIGMFDVEKLNKEYVTYSYRGKGDKEGTVTFTPAEYGTFEFRYFPAGTMLKSNYQHLARSNPITVGPQFKISAQLDAPTNKIRAKWAKISGNVYNSAWVGLFAKGEKNANYVTWEYATSPEVSFDAPIKPGTYEVRLFAYSLVCVAVSESITISGEDRLKISIADGIVHVEPHVVTVDPYQASAWLGLFSTSQPDNHQWIRYKYLKDRFQKTNFKLPKQAGTYELRLFADKTYDVIVKSEPFTIN